MRELGKKRVRAAARTRCNGRSLDREKTEGTDAIDEQREDRQLPRLHHGIAEIHQFELRHNGPLVE